MPELPEVTTVIKILNEELQHKVIIDVNILNNGTVLNENNCFIESLKNKEILFITRYGKFIIFHLSNNTILLSHLRMEGKYILLDKNSAIPKHSCVIFYLKDNKKLVYYDTRKFGILKVTTEQNYLSEKPLSHLGPEPFNLTQDQKNKIYSQLNKNKNIKELLLDQSIVCGIGNIYADEILYLSKINPFTKGKMLNEQDYDLLLKNAEIVLNKAIELGGSTIKSYHPKEGIDGKFQEQLQAYGNVGKTCKHCGTTFHKTFLGGRGTTFCPNCQVNPSLKKAIGITGIIGSGKTTVLNIFKELGYQTFSCDEIVENLYKDPIIARKINAIFSYKVLENNTLNKFKMRDMLKNNKVLHEKLENYVFPLVEQELINIVNTYNEPVIEVPLLFKAHLEYLFKKIIYVSTSIDNIKKRNEKYRKYNIDEAIDLYHVNNSYDIKSIPNLVEIKNNFNSIDELKNYIELNII